MILKLYSSGMTDLQIQEIVDSLYSHKYSTSTISVITDAVKEDVENFKTEELRRNILHFSQMQFTFRCVEIQSKKRRFLLF